MEKQPITPEVQCRPSTLKKIGRVQLRFRELYEKGIKIGAQTVRLRYDDAIARVAEECCYAEHTVEQIIKGQYLKYRGKGKKTSLPLTRPPLTPPEEGNEEGNLPPP